MSIKWECKITPVNPAFAVLLRDSTKLEDVSDFKQLAATRPPRGASDINHAVCDYQPHAPTVYGKPDRKLTAKSLGPKVFAESHSRTRPSSCFLLIVELLGS
jgi:hypothetical protein